MKIVVMGCILEKAGLLVIWFECSLHLKEPAFYLNTESQTARNGGEGCYGGVGAGDFICLSVAGLQKFGGIQCHGIHGFSIFPRKRVIIIIRHV